MVKMLLFWLKRLKKITNVLQILVLSIEKKLFFIFDPQHTFLEVTCHKLKIVLSPAPRDPFYVNKDKTY